MATLLERLQQALGDAYRVERELPLGGLGRLFLARELGGDGRQVIVRMLPPDVAVSADGGRFRSEIERTSRLRHPGLLAPISAGGKGDLLYCVAPHPPGEPLRQRLAREGPVPPAEAARLLADVADTLVFAHAEGLTDGGLDAERVYLADGRAVIADFGVGRALRAATTPGDDASDPRTDLETLAVLGHEMLAGAPRSLAPLPGEVPAVLTEIIARTLDADPSRRLGTAAVFRDRLAELLPVMRPWWKRPPVLLSLAAVMALVAVSVERLSRQRALEPNLIAVAPFEILDARHELWREGMVDVLAANLDGAGPLRTVSPSVSIRRWSGRPDAESAAELGRRTGARLVVFGRVVAAGADSIRLSAQLMDVATGVVLADVQLDEPEGRLDLLADSVTFQLLRGLARTRAISATRPGSLGSASLPALKAFLQGEQHYRRSQWESALAQYQRAIGLDSAFALALYRAGIVLGWQSSSADSLSRAYLLRAGSNNRGLPPRESMLVVSESLAAAVEEGPDNPEYWRVYRRLYATTAEAVRRYPDDPEAWYEFGETRYHYSFYASQRETLDAFDRSITLDSSFAPAYIHSIELALTLDGPVRSRRYADAYLSMQPRDIFADGIRLARLLMDPRRARARATQQVLDTASADLLVAALEMFRPWPDSAQTAVQLAALLDTARRASTEDYHDPEFIMAEQAASLAYRGRFREAFEVAGARFGWIVAGAATLGALPADTVDALLRRSLAAEPLRRSLALLGGPWWASRRDTASLRELARRGDSTARAARGQRDRAFGLHVAAAARSYWALARGDTAAALLGFGALTDTACVRCTMDLLAHARLLEAVHRDREAAVLLARDPPGFIHPTHALWMLLRGRVAERAGDVETAVRSYRFVADAWANADEALGPLVNEARAGLVRLTSR